MADTQLPAAELPAAEAKHQARIVGDVEYREGDGPKLVIRKGPVDIHTTEVDATLSWADGETRGSAAMPISDFKRYRAEGAIVVN